MEVILMIRTYAIGINSIRLTKGLKLQPLGIQNIMSNIVSI